MFLNAGQSINLSEKLSDQKRGIVLVLSRYESGASQDYGYCTYFVPKECLDFGVDKPGFDIPLVKYSDGSIVTGSKYIYMYPMIKSKVLPQMVHHLTADGYSDM